MVLMHAQAQAEHGQELPVSSMSAFGEQRRLVRLSRRIPTDKTGCLGWDLFRGGGEALLGADRLKKV